MATPNNVDLFSRYMAERFDEHELIAVPTTFQAFFGGPGSETVFSPDSLVVEIDIIRANERTAALIPRGMVSRPLGDTQKNFNVEKFTAFARKFPLSEEEGDIDANQILYRLAGEGANERQERLDRMRKLAVKIHMESIRRTVRMFEILAAQSIMTGKQDAIIGTVDTDLQYDFRRNANLTITPSTKWDVPGDILGDIDILCGRLRSIGKINPNAMFMSVEAFDVMIKDTTVQSLATNGTINLIRVNQDNPVPAEFNRFVASGWSPRGRLTTPGGYALWIFTSTDGYTNSAGTFTSYMTAQGVLITKVNARADRYFGPPELLPMIPQRQQLYSELFGINPMAPPMPPAIMNQGAIIDPSMFYCDAYVSGNWKRVTIRTQSAPIFATTQTDAFGIFKDVLT